MEDWPLMVIKRGDMARTIKDWKDELQISLESRFIVGPLISW